jgi:Xaa-Pro aminopeptidase
VLVTATGSKNLSEALPRDPDAVEAWMAGLWTDAAPNLGL